MIDCWDIAEFDLYIKENKFFKEKVDAIFHQGACTTTTEWDGCYMMKNNYTYSKHLLNYCLGHEVPFLYASSAAVYGTQLSFTENQGNESPINVYGYSKYLFDEYVRQKSINNKSQVIGLRYFNVYGPGEQHKGEMASTVFHFNNQLLSEKCVKLFKGSGGYADGEQLRDFIYVDDVIAVNLWFFENPAISGIFNVGTGKCWSFNDVARTIVDWHGFGDIQYIDFPEHLKESYQRQR